MWLAEDRTLYFIGFGPSETDITWSKQVIVCKKKFVFFKQKIGPKPTQTDITWSKQVIVCKKKFVFF